MNSSTTLERVLRMLKIYKGIPFTFSIRALSRTVGVSERTIYYWRKGKTEPTEQEAALMRLCLYRMTKYTNFKTPGHEN
ncbi:MAG TPA: hypothetical protein PLI34_03540 [Saprospiraceae bacterium]|nr:hypothetical protein [Saprospiraceae bacterium]HRK80224.1 hypothetical protein [Saprospiraceae bacterium]